MSTALYVDRVATAKPADGRKYSNGARSRRNEYPQNGGTAPFSNEQKAALCILADQAFRKIHGLAWYPGREIEAWRRSEQQKCVGKRSLTTCTQGDYLPLKAHFLDLAGESGAAMNAHVEDATADRRLAMHKLREECTARGLTLAWPGAICRNKFKTTLDDATAPQLWKLVFDVRKSKHKPKGKAPQGRAQGEGRKAMATAGPLPPRLVIKRPAARPVAPDNIPF